MSVLSREYSSRPRSLIAFADSAIVSWRQPYATALQQRDQRRRRREDHLLVDAVLDQRRILLERGAQERLARDEQHDELRRLVELRPVALRRELHDVIAHLARVVAELREPVLFVVALERLEVRLAGALRVDDDGLGAGQLHDEVGAEPPVVGRDVVLCLEVAMLEHPRHLDDAAQLDLAPAAADVRPVAERAHEVPGLAAQVLLALGEDANLCRQIRVRPRACELELLQLAVDLRERLLDRRDEVLDRLLALVEILRRLLLQLLELGLRELEERSCCSRRARRRRAPSSSSRATGAHRSRAAQATPLRRRGKDR